MPPLIFIILTTCTINEKKLQGDSRLLTSGKNYIIVIISNSCNLPGGICWVGLEGGITMNEQIAQLRKILDDSTYTVALCGSGMMEEGGFIGIKKQDKHMTLKTVMAMCGRNVFQCIYNTRPEQFSSL